MIKEKLINDLTPGLVKTTRTWYITFGIFVLMYFVGLYALYLQIDQGHIVTGMRDNVVWGVYIVNFIFFMGLSYAGALLSGSLHLFKSTWRAPLMRMAELITVISLLVGPFFIFFCIGRLDRIPYLIIHPRIQSPITWDVVAITTDLFGCFIFLYLSMIEDFAILRDQKALKIKSWQRKLYSVLALNYRGTETQVRILKNARNIMSAMIIAIAIIVYSVLAWIFGVTLQPGWHSTIFGPYFVIAAVFSGTGLLILLMWLYRKVYNLQDYIRKEHFVKIGVVLLVVSAFYGYFTFSDYLTKWYGSVVMDSKLIDKLFSEYYWMFIFANYVGIILPIRVAKVQVDKKYNHCCINCSYCSMDKPVHYCCANPGNTFCSYTGCPA